MRVRTSGKKEQIVDIAAAVFREQGFERASMAEIAGRVGGSKGTLYGYFASKEELFLAVTHSAAEAHFGTVWSEFDATHDIAAALQNLGIKFLTFVLQAEVVAAHRMVLAVSGQSDIGRTFYARGPETGLQMLSSFLGKAIDTGCLKRADAWLMAQQLIALLEAELRTPFMFGVQSQLPATAVLEATVARAVEVFMAAYAATRPLEAAESTRPRPSTHAEGRGIQRRAIAAQRRNATRR